MQAGTLFCDSAFQREVATGTLSSTSLDRYTCVALAGVATGASPGLPACSGLDKKSPVHAVEKPPASSPPNMFRDVCAIVFCTVAQSKYLLLVSGLRY